MAFCDPMAGVKIVPHVESTDSMQQAVH